MNPSIPKKVASTTRRITQVQKAYLPEIITVTSGKGGVGKTNLAVNLGIALSQRKQRVLLIDADLQLGKMDIILGASPRYTLSELMDGSKTIQEIIMPHPSGIEILPATSGDLNLLEADNQMLRILAESFSSIQSLYDYVIVDTSAGVSSTVLTMALGADKVVLVVTPEPASVSDVYAMIKVINSKAPELPLILVPNRHSSAEDGVDLHKKLNLITQKFLKISVSYGGTIVEYNAVRQAVIRQKPFILEFPRSQAAHDVQMVTHRLLKFPAQLVEHRSNIFERLRVKRKEVESA
jgi:flagellar biosynthesis protein FlhG